MKPDSDGLVSRIYDCALNPELWEEALTAVRDAVDAAHVAIGLAEPMGDSRWRRCNRPWDDCWLDQLGSLQNEMPRSVNQFSFPVDKSWTALSQTSEMEFQSSRFYQEWVKPQDLRDFLSLNYLKRNHSNHAVVIPTGIAREPVSQENRRLIERLSPHIRRAVLINDMTDQRNLAACVYRDVMNQLTVGVFVLGHQRKLLFANGAAENLLSEGDKISSVAGHIHAVRHSSAFNDAVDRALHAHVTVEVAASGVPLIGQHGERAAAYILPLNSSNAQAAFGRGRCVVFVSGHTAQSGLASNILRSLFDLTSAEARISLMVAMGHGPQDIANILNIKVNTVRTHLKHIYAKADVADQTGLAGCINMLLPPIQ